MKTIPPGLVVLLGSGETLPTSGKTHEYVAQRLPDSRQVVILETPAGFEPNSALVAEKIKTYLQQRLQNFNLNIKVLPVRKKGTPFSPESPEIVAPIYEADEILLGPGSPTYCVRQLQDSLAMYAIMARHRLGATLFLSSSAVLSFSALTMPVYEIYKVGEDLHWKPGLDFLGMYGLPLVIIPHWNNTDGGSELDTSHCYMGQARFGHLRRMLDPAYKIIGIDEHTSLILNFAEACCHVMGKGQITLLHTAGKTVFHTGETFPMSDLGAWRIPHGEEGIPANIWQRALQAQQEQIPGEKTTAVSATPTPSAEVLDLVEQRSAARAAENWAAADVLRAQLATLGWQIQDTPDGPELKPAQNE